MEALSEMLKVVGAGPLDGKLQAGAASLPKGGKGKKIAGLATAIGMLSVVACAAYIALTTAEGDEKRAKQSESEDSWIQELRVKIAAALRDLKSGSVSLMDRFVGCIKDAYTKACAKLNKEPSVQEEVNVPGEPEEEQTEGAQDVEQSSVTDWEELLDKEQREYGAVGGTRLDAVVPPVTLAGELDMMEEKIRARYKRGSVERKSALDKLNAIKQRQARIAELNGLLKGSMDEIYCLLEDPESQGKQKPVVVSSDCIPEIEDKAVQDEARHNQQYREQLAQAVQDVEQCREDVERTVEKIEQDFSARSVKSASPRRATYVDNWMHKLAELNTTTRSFIENGRSMISQPSAKMLPFLKWYLPKMKVVTRTKKLLKLELGLLISHILTGKLRNGTSLKEYFADLLDEYELRVPNPITVARTLNTRKSKTSLLAWLLLAKDVSLKIKCIVLKLLFRWLEFMVLSAAKTALYKTSDAGITILHGLMSAIKFMPNFARVLLRLLRELCGKRMPSLASKIIRCLKILFISLAAYPSMFLSSLVSKIFVLPTILKLRL